MYCVQRASFGFTVAWVDPPNPTYNTHRLPWKASGVAKWIEQKGNNYCATKFNSAPQGN